jgi:hypothetical protein
MVSTNNRSITGSDVTAVVTKSSVLWDITPCSPLKVNQCWMKMSPAYFMLLSCLAYYSALKMEKIFSSETSVAYHVLYPISQNSSTLQLIHSYTLYALKRT